MRDVCDVCCVCDECCVCVCVCAECCGRVVYCGPSCAAGAPCMSYAAPPIRSSLGLEPCEGRRGVGIFVSRASCLARNAAACIDARCHAVRSRRRGLVYI